MAIYEGKKLTVDNAPIKNLNKVISLFDADDINENFTIVTQNSNTLSVKYKSEKITY